jgi:uncharacterized protein YcbX
VGVVLLNAWAGRPSVTGALAPRLPIRQIAPMLRVTSLALAPVKGMRLVPVDALQLTSGGAAGDRAFLPVGPDGALLSTERTPALLQVRPAYDAATGVLGLTFPDGRTVSARTAGGERGQTELYNGRVVPGTFVGGELAAALSEHLGQPVRLLARDPAHAGADDAPVSLVSRASCAALAPELGGTEPDPRRYRMAITVEGPEAWEEDGWVDGELRVGGATLRVAGRIPRCVVITHDPDDGHRDVPALKALATVRGKKDVFLGVWCEVVTPGAVAVGDEVAVAAPVAAD